MALCDVLSSVQPARDAGDAVQPEVKGAWSSWEELGVSKAHNWCSQQLPLLLFLLFFLLPGPGAGRRLFSPLLRVRGFADHPAAWGSAGEWIKKGLCFSRRRVLLSTHVLLCVLLTISQMLRQLARPWAGGALSVGVANKVLIDLSGHHMTFNFMAEFRVLPQIKGKGIEMR